MDALLDDDRGDATPPCAARVWAEFLAVLETLPPTTRAVFLLHALFDASAEDIERMTGMHRQTCRHHLAAARRSMRDAIPGIPSTHPQGDIE